MDKLAPRGLDAMGKADGIYGLSISGGKVTDLAVAGGSTAATYQPGSADKPPTTPNVRDDEFDGSSSVTWTTTPTAPATWDVNTIRAHHAYIKATSAQGSNAVGKVQAVPGAYPFTFTTKAMVNLGTNFSFAGLLLAPAGALSGTSLMVYFGPQFNSGSSSLAVRRGSNNLAGTGSFSQTVSTTFLNQIAAWYLRITVNSATSIDLLASGDGYSWTPIQTAFNPGFTPGAMGLCASYNSGATVDAYFDFFRVT
jgi:hypothetical protein